MSSENISQLQLVLYRLYAHEITVQEAYKTITEEMTPEIPQHTNDEFGFIENLWEDFGHVPKTVDYLIEALHKKKEDKRIGNPFKSRFLYILRKIFVDCELGENTLSKAGSTPPDYNIKDYGPTNYEYWNGLLEAALELYDNHWFIVFAREYEVKKSFFLFLQKHTLYEKLSRDNRVLLKRYSKETALVYTKTTSTTQIHEWCKSYNTYMLNYLCDVDTVKLLECITGHMLSVSQDELYFCSFKLVYDRLKNKKIKESESVQLLKRIQNLLYLCLLEGVNYQYHNVINYMYDDFLQNIELRKIFTQSIIADSFCFTEDVMKKRWLFLVEKKLYLDKEYFTKQMNVECLERMVKEYGITPSQIFGEETL